ncbi:TetR/AcrR family transcriptional regulator [Aeromicrobium sp. Leaf350]|uniref:TetR/AcrR family transcriptional regulator n=1 Tax=Aeromicrobium sp. Leaf350 TaxID=2876565 RepID=UPI001E39C31B|nr:TetR/AcrR family transcriptional regulator [Aeromicrobium sp. Leaf350]
MAIRTSSEKKLLDAAEELFFTHGIGATPIDAVIARAGVSPATLYRGYASKEALVAAALERRHQDWVDVWQRAVDQQTSPTARLLAVFDALDDFRSRPEGARWCAFLGSAAEYADPPPEIAQAVTRDTDTLRSRLQDLAAPWGEPDAERLADELLLLVSGHLAMRLRDAEHSTGTARAIAASLLAARPEVPA